ncbi:PEP-CTERM sorting domain-containing protein [Mariniblastus sp.]|nr:PEP-CTERM sorting domain-containing protein [Mariniblastus sp.]
MIRPLTYASIFLLSLAFSSAASADIIVDFTSPGPNGTFINGQGFSFQSQDLNGTGVSFTVTASAVIPAGGGANNGNIARQNSGLGSTVENTGGFLNVIGGVSEVLEFSISGVTGLQPGETLVFTDLLSQNANASNPNQSGGFGGAFGQQAVDSVTFSFDGGAPVVINQTDAGDLGAILLNSNNNNNTNTGNTFAHGGLSVPTTTFTIAQTDLDANNAVTIQGFQFDVVSAVPEPSSALVLGFGSLALLARRRKRS